MHRIVGSVTSLVQHLVAVATDPEIYRPSACPHCGYARVWHHGCYHRKADRGAPTDASRELIPVLRFLCAACPRTCSRLPACISPRRWYDWAMQQAVLLLLLAGCSLRHCARCGGVDRRTVGRWRDWLHDRDDRFAFFLRNRWPELGRVAEFVLFWRNVIDTLSMQVAFAWLDRNLDIP